MKKRILLKILIPSLIVMLILPALFSFASAEVKDSTVGITGVVLEAPSISPLCYGEVLNDAYIYGGVVIDPHTNRTIRGSWSPQAPYLTPQNNAYVTVIFTPDDTEKYLPLLTTTTVQVSETTPVCFADYENNQTVYVGNTIYFSDALTNPHSVSLRDFGEMRAYYTLDGEEEKYELEDNFLEIPEEYGRTLTLHIEYDGLKGMYTPCQGELTYHISEQSADIPTLNEIFALFFGFIGAIFIIFGTMILCLFIWGVVLIVCLGIILPPMIIPALKIIFLLGGIYTVILIVFAVIRLRKALKRRREK